MRVTILKKRWTLRFTRLPKGTDGECDPPETTGKEIRIQQPLDEKNQLETVIHEALHASDWHRSEEWVEEVARDLARILWRLGYRRETVDDKSSK